MAQTNLASYVQHVIVVIQENRTPDNLFNEDANLYKNGGHVRPNLPGQLTNYGACLPPNAKGDSYVALQSNPLYTCWDLTHSHGTAGQPNPDGWLETWDSGAMDGACNIKVLWQQTQDYCQPPGPPCANSGPGGTSTCPYAYVENAPWAPPQQDSILDPYFQIAEQYGFANYTFATNQGPISPAHQFLLSGTSAPDYNGYDDGGCGSNKIPCYKWFDSNNVSATVEGATGFGCTADYGIESLDIDPGQNQSYAYAPNYVPGANPGFPCYTHNSLPTLLDNAEPNPISWVYYSRDRMGGYSGIWTAPTAINDLCDTTGTGGECGPNSDWQTHVGPFRPDQGKYLNDEAPILTDIASCSLQQVSWVIPDGNWSDHAGSENSPGDGGPSWVAAIVNAVGSQPTCANGDKYWNDTVILVVWDDWGGWYDDVVPPDCASNPCTGYSGGGGNGKQYVYGFRVPLLVVGAYTQQVTPQGGYISGPQSNPTCPGSYYCHDFGSILNFIEYAFGTGGYPLGIAPPNGAGISQDPTWPYADYFAMDYSPHVQYSYSLSDFFNFSPSSFHSFQTIQGAKYGETCFHNPNQTGCFPGTYPMDPDNDANE